MAIDSCANDTHVPGSCGHTRDGSAVLWRILTHALFAIASHRGSGRRDSHRGSGRLAWMGLDTRPRRSVGSGRLKPVSCSCNTLHELS